MGTIITWLLRLYFGIGVLLGVVLFASLTMQTAFRAPPVMELAAEAGKAAVFGTLRVFFWAPSVFERVVKNGEHPFNWLIY